MLALFNQIVTLSWLPVILFLFLISIFLTFKLRFIQFRKLPYALRCLRVRQDKLGEEAAVQKHTGEVSPLKALTIALAATIGVGNIAGVATAIYLGGPGAVFWIWVMALLGMVLKYSEAVLAVHYRQRSERGEFIGGPMYYIKNGLGKKWHWLGFFYAFAGIGAMVGIGNLVQANAVSEVMQSTFSIPPVATGIAIALLAAVILVGGVRRIGRVTVKLVPIMAILYVSGGLAVIGFHVDRIPAALSLIVTSAFTGTAAVGGFAGAMLIEAIRFGVARGVFANEAGMGTAAIAHAVAKSTPVKQGAIAMLGTCVDSFMMCTMTALVIILTGAWMSGDNGAVLSLNAFSNVLSVYGTLVVTVCVVIFAFSTLIAYSYYGERCAEYLMGEKVIKPYRVIWVVAAFVGAVMQLELVWLIADLLNAFMILPNIIALLLLSPVVIRLTQKHFATKKKANDAHLSFVEEESK